MNKTILKIRSHVARVGLFLAVCAAGIANAQNGYFQNFTAPGIPSAFTWETSYAVSVQNQALEVIVNKANLFHGVTVTFPTALNLSASARRKVSFRIKTDTTTRKLPYEIGLAFFNAGATNQVGGRRTNKIIYPTGKWQTVSFDFNDAGFTPHNFSAVTQLNINFQPMGYMQGNTKVQIDDLAVGDNGVVGQAAIVSPYFTGIDNQEISINTTTSVSIRNAVDSDNLNSNVTFTAASSNTSILPNPTFQTSPVLSNSYFSFTSGNGSTGDLQTNRVIKMLMTPNTNQSGMVTVTITATAASQVGATSVPYRYIINVNVKRNIAPTIGTIPTSLTIGSDRKTDIFLDNIVSGNGEVAQILSISGLSSDQTILQNSQIVASYNGISLSGKLSITPIQFSSPASKIFNLTVTVSDNGGIVAGGSDRTSYVIPITVLPTFYNAPTIGVIPNQIDNIITQGPRTIRIEPITDGNGGSRITSVTAVSGNTGILANPTVSYTTGNNFALLTYNSLLVGTTDISVTATNFGAPANSNGNSSFTRSFTMKALAPAQPGYIEPMTVQTIVGAPLNPGTQADGRFSTVAGTWYVENQGTQQTVTINTTTGVMTIAMNKDGTAPGYFSGVWYKPYGGGELFDFATSPYISVRLSGTNPQSLPNLGVAIDLWDVNGIRYGLDANVQVTPTATTYTFCYTGTPSPGFNFSKVKTILFNFGQTVSSVGTGTWTPYTGTMTMSDLRIGSLAVGSGSCTLPVPSVVIGDTPNPFHLTTQTGPKTVTITGINAGSTPITGKNINPVNLSAAGAFSPSVLSFNTTTGVAVIQYTTGGAATGVITVTGNASGSNTTRRTFTVTVQAPPASQNILVTNDLNANFADGNKGQTIDGSPFGVCEIWAEDGGSNQPDSYYQNLKDVGIKSMRIGIWDFEPKNDNNDPFSLDKTKLDYTAMGVDFFKKANAAGVERFMVTFFSPPSFVKYNNSYGVPNAPFEFAPGFVVTNTVDSTFYEEYAEYAVAFVQGIKEKSGVDVWGLSIGNEIQFNQTYQSVVYTTSQYVEIVRRVGRRLAAAGLKTFIWGAETLQGQDAGNNYLKACQADPEVRNYLAGYAIHAYAANGVGQAAPSWGNVVIDSRDTRSNGGLTLMRQSAIATVGPGGEQHNGNGGSGIPIYQTETSQGGVATVAEWSNALGIFAGVSTSLSVGKNSGWYYIGLTKDYKMYYTYKHMNKFVFGGARHIPVTQPAGTNVNAFRNPDGSVCVMLANDNSMKTFSFGGTNMPSVNRAYLSVDNLYWQDLGTITGSISVPPNAILTLWGGGNALVAASGVTVSGANTTNVTGGSIQFTETVLPANLVDKSVTWSVITQTGNAIVDASGLMTAVSNGTVRVRATSVATPTVFGEIVVTISGQYVKVTNITVDGLGGVRSVAAASTLQMTVTGVLPTVAPLRDASWTLNPPSGIASINTNGLLTGISSGIVTVIGTSLDNNTVTSRVVVTVTSSSVAITSATVTGGSNQITTGGGTLAMTSTFSPANATSTTVGWAISGSIASINPTTGLVTALNSGNGVVTVTSTYAAWGISATRVITISGQTSLITSATINGLGGSSVINTANGSLQMTVTGFLPTDATNTTPTWSVLAPAFGNTINASGLLSATNNSNGVITVQAAFGAVLATRIITVSNQNVPLTAATINGVGGVSVINTANGTLQMTVSGVAPSGANTNTTPTWSVLAPAFGNTINASTGLLQATTNSNGVITVQAAFGAVLATRVITVSNQNVPLTAATINGLGGVSVINTANGTLQMTVSGIAPLGANTNLTPTWSVLAPAFGNTINASSGLLQATTNSNGVITVQAAFGAVLATRVITVSNQNVPLTAATINGLGGISVINTANGTLQMTVSGVAPSGANTNLTPIWSVLLPDFGNTINASSGLLQATTNSNGVITVQAAFGAVLATRIITVSNQNIPLTSATINGLGGVSVINTANGTLQMTVSGVAPSGANTNLTPTWSVLAPNLGNTINATTGLLQATTNSNGVITVQAAFGAVLATRIITVSNQNVPLTAATINGVGGVSVINTANGTLQMTVSGIAPSGANTNTTPTWSVLAPNLGNAINATTGLLQATTNSNGVITVQAAFGAVLATRVITVSNQNVPLTAATINGVGGVSVINTANGTLQMTVSGIAPLGANTNLTPTWSVLAPALGNSINASSGLLQATTNSNGVITVQAAFGAVLATRVITVSNQNVPVTAATINGVGGVSVIATNLGTLQLTTTGLAPLGANQNTTPVWSLIAGSAASLNVSTGILTAINNGTVTVQGVFGAVVATQVITVSNQLTGISITAANSLIGVDLGTKQMILTYLPATASASGVNWSTNNANASVNSSGLVSALLNGLVTVTAISVQNNAFVSSYVITITNQAASFVAVSSIALSGTATILSTGNTTITTSVLPANATNPAVTWTLFPPSGIASIGASTSNNVILNGVGNGVVTLTGTSVSTSSISGIRIITVSGFAIPVTSTTVNGTGGVNQITAANGTLQMLAPYLPANANSNTTLGWSMSDPTGKNLFNISTGVLTAQNDGNGLVTITGTYGAVVSRRVVTISGQGITATSMTVNGSNITTQSGTTPMSVIFNPSNANVGTTVGWSSNNTSIATINNTTGIVTAVSNGTVTITGTAGALTAIRVLTISGQFVAIPVTSTTVNGTGGVNQITVANGTLQMLAPYSPANANQNTLLGWSMIDPTGKNSLNAVSGLLQANNDGNGLVTITGSYGAVVSTRVVTISGQGITATSMTVNGANITTQSGTTPMSVVFNPSNANVGTTVGWTTSNASIASVNASTGIVSAVTNGTVTITGTAGALTAIRVLTISGQFVGIPVTSTTVNGTGGVNQITVANGTLQMLAPYSPANANQNTLLGWSMIDPTGKNSLNAVSGLLQANNDGNGLVTITGSYGAVVSIRVVTISGQGITATSMTVNGANITTQSGTTPMSVVFNPANANVGTTVGWTTSNASIASVNASTGIVSAVTNGTVTITGTAGALSAIRVLTISGQFVGIPVTSTTVNGTGGVNQITVANGTLQMLAPYSPANANQNTLLGWSMIDPTGKNSLNAVSGLLQANNDGNGLVTITGSYGAVISRRVVTISGQGITATSMTVNGANITVLNGTSQMTALFGPVGANVGTNVTWSSTPNGRVNGTGLVSANGINEIITITGTAGSLSAIKVITISGQIIPVSSISISGVNIINIANGFQSLSATVLPSNATNPTFTWSVITVVGGGKANINNLGIVSATRNGDGVITIVGSAQDGSGVKGYFPMTISGQDNDLASLTVFGQGGNAISVNGGSKLMQTTPFPSNANGAVTWSIITASGQGRAIIDNTGLVTTLIDGNGTVTVVGTSIENASISSFAILTITGQTVSVIQITLTSSGVNTISTNGGVANLSVIYSPINTTQTNVSYSSSPSGFVNIDPTGQVTAVDNGVVTITAVSNINPLLTSSLVFTISGQLVKQVTLSGIGGSNDLNTLAGTLQMVATTAPVNAIPESAIWTILGQKPTNAAYNGNDLVTINSITGLVTSRNFSNGLVTISGYLPNSSITSIVVISVSNQREPVLLVNGGADKSIVLTGGDVSLTALLGFPAIATDRSLSYTVISGTGIATVDATGKVFATDGGNGIATIRVASNSDPNVFDDVLVTISGQTSSFTVEISDGSSNVQPVLGSGADILYLFPVFTPIDHPAIPFNRNTLVSFSSNPTGIVDISTISGSAEMTSLSAGITTVTCVYVNNPSITYNIVVTVTSIPTFSGIITVTSLTISGSTSITTKGGTMPMSVVFNPSNANVGTTLGWVSSNPAIASVDASSGLVTAISNGIVTITATSGSLSSIFVISISGQQSNGTNSVSTEINSNFKFELSPVPATDVLNLNTKQDLGSAIVKIFNSEGRLVAEYSTNSTIGYEMDITQLARGYYTLVINSKNGVVSKSFVKQ